MLPKHTRFIVLTTILATACGGSLSEDHYLGDLPPDTQETGSGGSDLTPSGEAGSPSELPQGGQTSQLPISTGGAGQCTFAPTWSTECERLDTDHPNCLGRMGTLIYTCFEGAYVESFEPNLTAWQITGAGCVELPTIVEPDPTLTVCGSSWLNCDGTDGCEVQVSTSEATCIEPGVNACVWASWLDLNEAGEPCEWSAGCLWCRLICLP